MGARTCIPYWPVFTTDSAVVKTSDSVYWVRVKAQKPPRLNREFLTYSVYPHQETANQINKTDSRKKPPHNPETASAKESHLLTNYTVIPAMEKFQVPTH